MTGLQALVALALFAPGVLAPQLGYGEGAISLFATACFAVGVATSLYGGLLARGSALPGGGAVRAGDRARHGRGEHRHPRRAAHCRALIVGLAFGPETPGQLDAAGAAGASRSSGR